MMKRFLIPGRGIYVLTLRPQSGDTGSHVVILEKIATRKNTYECDSYQQATEVFNAIRDTLELVLI